MNPAEQKTLLSIDCGTQSLRGMIFDLRGRLIAKSRETYLPYYSEKPAWEDRFGRAGTHAKPEVHFRGRLETVVDKGQEFAEALP